MLLALRENVNMMGIAVEAATTLDKQIQGTKSHDPDHHQTDRLQIGQETADPETADQHLTDRRQTDLEIGQENPDPQRGQRKIANRRALCRTENHGKRVIESARQSCVSIESYRQKRSSVSLLRFETHREHDCA